MNYASNIHKQCVKNLRFLTLLICQFWYIAGYETHITRTDNAQTWDGWKVNFRIEIEFTMESFTICRMVKKSGTLQTRDFNLNSFQPASWFSNCSVDARCSNKFNTNDDNNTGLVCGVSILGGWHLNIQPSKVPATILRFDLESIGSLSWLSNKSKNGQGGAQEQRAALFLWEGFFFLFHLFSQLWLVFPFRY